MDNIKEEHFKLCAGNKAYLVIFNFYLGVKNCNAVLLSELLGHITLRVNLWLYVLENNYSKGFTNWPLMY